MVLGAVLLAIDVALLASGYGEYTTLGMGLGLLGLPPEELQKPMGQMGRYKGKKKKTFDEWFSELSPEQQEALQQRWINSAVRREDELYYKGLVAEERHRVEATQDALKNRRVDIASLPTTTDLRRIDKGRLQKQGIPVATPTVVDDTLALRKIEMDEINREALVRNQSQETRLREAKENADEERAKRLARKTQLEGTLNLLSQNKEQASSDLSNFQQMQAQQQNLIQKSQEDSDAANLAVILAEQQQRAKNAYIPADPQQRAKSARRLPPSVKYGGGKGKKSILKRLMEESNMTLKEAKEYIKIYGI